MEENTIISAQEAGDSQPEPMDLETEEKPKERGARLEAKKKRQQQMQAEDQERKRRLEDKENERRTKRMLDEEAKEQKRKEIEAKKLEKQRLRQEKEQQKLEKEKLKQDKEKEKLELKAKAEAERLEKLQKKQEEKELKLKEIEDLRLRKLEEKQQKAALKQQQEEEKRLKLEEEKKKKEEKEKTEIKPICKPLTDFFKRRVTAESEQSRESTEPAEIEPMKIDSNSPEEWRVFWRTQNYIAQGEREAFIYIHDSALKPYFTGKRHRVRLHRNFLKLMDCVDYDRDSEIEFEEQNAEDLGEEELSEEEESEDSDESVAEFVVPDNYMSDEEENSQGERAEITLVSNECKPLTILNTEMLQALSIISITNSQFPLLVHPPHARTKDEDWVPDLLGLIEGKGNKNEVLTALRERHPTVSMRAVNLKIKEVAIKAAINGSKRQYYLKENVPEVPVQAVLQFPAKPEDSS
mmetsp:Transcript_1795/g.3889  ORF Transcript_1795/g.3889 Transcript_1795/m.3889 type:complete len:466 (+) Transcript_1795:1781-3178(+)